MRFATRTFLYSFLPFAVLLLGIFFAIDTMVSRAVRHELRSSLRKAQATLVEVQRRNELQTGRTLRVLSENAVLKAGLQLVSQYPRSSEAKRTLEEQLLEVGQNTGLDLLVSWSADGLPQAGVLRKGDSWRHIDTKTFRIPDHGLFLQDGVAYQVTSIPVNQAGENIAMLSVGDRFDVSKLGLPAVLLAGSRVVTSSWPVRDEATLESLLRVCKPQDECEVRFGGQSYLSLALQSDELGEGFVLRTMQSVDKAVAPVQSVLRHVFVVAGVGALLAALIIAAVSSRSIVRPIAEVVRQLKEGQRTGDLPEFFAPRSEAIEICELTQSFNHLARAVRAGHDELLSAYVECVRSLASALDARDPYTAGHSRRVSDISCAMGSALGLDTVQMETLRTGALLHDIGKIGIPDSVLQKPGRLTPEEFGLIRQHPEIGRRILDGVHGLAPFLSTVEFHHENWDGSGYPHGLRCEETPLFARIVHVADAYDAMTSDRPYRRGMEPEAAMEILKKNRGTQFDPQLVDVLAGLWAAGTNNSLSSLFQAVQCAEAGVSELANMETV